MSSAQCLRRLAIRPVLRAASCTAPRASAGLRTLSTGISYSKALPALSGSSTSLQPLQARHFSLTSRYHEEQIVKVPTMAESISEGTLKQFSKQVGDYVELDEEIATIETDKIDVAVNAPAAGTIKEFLANEEDTVTVGQDLVKLELGGEPGQKAEKAGSEPKEAATSDQKTSSQTEGETEKSKSEPKEESKPAPKEESKPAPKQESKPEPKQESKPAPPKQESKPAPPKQEQKPKKEESKPKESESKSESPYGNREERRIKMNRMRLRIAERLKQSQNTAASLTTFNEVDMSALMNLRKKYKDEVLKKTGVKFGFMSAFSRAAVLAMKEVPTVNASIEGPGGGDTIVYKDYVDISVAVATEKGLVTPVVRNAESMDMIGIEKSIAELGKKARDNKLTIEDMAGGTFTISNGGVFGSLMGTPIINLPQTAVLGLHAINQKPVAIDGKVEIRPMMYLALTYDHRLLDGREAVTFLVKIKEYIEDPSRMLLF
ncbi:dihydrolipoamide succinyltransferase like protein [Zymoseptoria brevis]|uniref:dihydrolipoyllysine-residue succinyltransferase n=1 Tax=Zymoseptoria brevis TaxID=1047168 RepID=A0A0F4GDK9_9PEZI|nr:dihydrolipoamide succinyltransferase like protein [Zymoseptoria brevis]